MKGIPPAITHTESLFRKCSVRVRREMSMNVSSRNCRTKFAEDVTFLWASFWWERRLLSFQTRPKWILNFTLKYSSQNLFKISDLFSAFWQIFQQDGTPACAAKLSQDWIATDWSEFISKDEWSLNSPDFSPNYSRDGSTSRKCPLSDTLCFKNQLHSQSNFSWRRMFALCGWFSNSLSL